jgi:hypothetical protein
MWREIAKSIPRAASKQPKKARSSTIILQVKIIG